MHESWDRRDGIAWKSVDDLALAASHLVPFEYVFGTRPGDFGIALRQRALVVSEDAFGHIADLVLGKHVGFDSVDHERIEGEVAFSERRGKPAESDFELV